MIKSAESALIQPRDRDYKQKSSVRQVHSLRTGGQTMILIKKEDGVYEEK